MSKSKKFKVNDLVRYIGNDANPTFYTKGVIYKIINELPKQFMLTDNRGNYSEHPWTKENLHIHFEVVKDLKAFQPGETVKCIQQPEGFSELLFSVGKIYKVVQYEDYTDDSWHCIITNTGSKYCVNSPRLREYFELVKEVPKFKVGDKVRCLKTNNWYKKDQIYIVDIDEDHGNELFVNMHSENKNPSGNYLYSSSGFEGCADQFELVTTQYTPEFIIKGLANLQKYI